MFYLTRIPNAILNFKAIPKHANSNHIPNPNDISYPNTNVIPNPNANPNVTFHMMCIVFRSSM